MGETIIIGSGLAGLACARGLGDAGMAVHVLDKGRVIGGRMATRHVATAHGALSFDHGAQYLRPRSPEFARAMVAAGARPWPDDAALVGAPGMATLAQVLAEGISVTQQTEVQALHRQDGLWQLHTSTGKLQARRLVLTIPAPQALRLLGRAHPLAPELSRVVMEPCLTLMAAFPADSPRPFAHRLDPAHPLSWIARDSAKPGRSTAATTWVAQASPTFSRDHLEATPEELAPHLLTLLAQVLGADAARAFHVRAHRWRHAQASVPMGRAFLHDAGQALHVGGDWCLGPRAEDAWQSGRAIAQHILQGPHLG